MSSPYLPPPLDPSADLDSSIRPRNFSDFLSPSSSPDPNASTQPLTVQYADSDTESRPGTAASSRSFTLPGLKPRGPLAPMSADEQSRQAALREKLSSNAGTLKMSDLLNRPRSLAAPAVDPTPNLQSVVKKLKLHEANPNSYEAQHARLLHQSRVTGHRPQDLDPNYESPADREVRLKKLQRMKSPEQEELEMEERMPVDPMAERTLDQLGINEELKRNEDDIYPAEVIEEKRLEPAIPGAATNSPLQNKNSGQSAASAAAEALIYTVAPTAPGAPPLLVKGEPVLQRREDYMESRKPLNRSAEPDPDETFVENKNSGKFMRISIRDPNYQSVHIDKQPDAGAGAGSVLFAAANPAQRAAAMKGPGISTQTAAMIRSGAIRLNAQTGQLEFTGKGRQQANDDAAVESLNGGVNGAQSVLLAFYTIASALLAGFTLVQMFIISSTRWSENLFTQVYFPIVASMSQCGFILVHVAFIASAWRFYLESVNGRSPQCYYYRYFWPHNSTIKNDGKLIWVRNFVISCCYFIGVLVSYAAQPTDTKLRYDPLNVKSSDLQTWFNCMMTRFVLAELAFAILSYKLLYAEYYFLAFQQLQGYFMNPSHYNQTDEHEPEGQPNVRTGKPTVTRKILTGPRMREIQQIVVEKFINLGSPDGESAPMPIPAAAAARPMQATAKAAAATGQAV